MVLAGLEMLNMGPEGVLRTLSFWDLALTLLLWQGGREGGRERKKMVM